MIVLAWLVLAAFAFLFLVAIDQTLFQGALIPFLFVLVIVIGILFGIISLFAWAINTVTI